MHAQVSPLVDASSSHGRAPMPARRFHPATQPPTSHPPPSHQACPSMPARSTSRYRRAGPSMPARRCRCRLVDASQPPPASHLSGAVCKPKAPIYLLVRTPFLPPVVHFGWFYSGCWDYYWLQLPGPCQGCVQWHRRHRRNRKCLYSARVYMIIHLRPQLSPLDRHPCPLGCCCLGDRLLKLVLGGSSSTTSSI